MLVTPDWTAVAILAAVVLAEGLRRVPDGAVVLRALGLSEWIVVERVDDRAGWRLISWWSPLTRHVVLLPPVDGAVCPPEQVRERLRVVQSFVRRLEAVGALQLGALLLGVPIASAQFGGTGFLALLALVAGLTMACALDAHRGFRKLGIEPSQAWRWTVSLLSPFAASQASERLLEAAFQGASPVTAAQLLMTEGDFHAWIRPAVFDLAQGGNDPYVMAHVLSARERADVLRVGTRDGVVCPRCGRDFQAGIVQCPECDNLPLVHVGYSNSLQGGTE